MTEHRERPARAMPARRELDATLRDAPGHGGILARIKLASEIADGSTTQPPPAPWRGSTARPARRLPPFRGIQSAAGYLLSME